MSRNTGYGGTQKEVVIEKNILVQPAYDQCIKASHLFNVLDSRGVISTAQRQVYIGRVRALAKLCADAYIDEVSSRV